MTNRYLYCRRGVALLLVLIAVAIAVTLACSFLAAQSTTIGICGNLENHSNARHVAESGLELAIAYVRSDNDWRSLQSHGAWVTGEPFGEGTFTIVGEDGVDTDGDGAADGDGDLADDPDDPLTLTVTGKVNGASHVVRAVVTPVPSGVCGPGIAVSDKIEVKSGHHYDGSGRIDPMSGTAAIATNSTSNDKIKAKDTGVISTDVYIGPGGNPDNEPGNVVKIEGSGQITGTIHALEEAITMPTLSEPTDVGDTLGHLTLSSGTTTWSANRRYNKLKLESSAILEINGNITVLCDGDVEFKGDSRLNILSNSTLTLYLNKKLKCKDQSKANVNTADPLKFVVRSLATGGSAKIELEGTAQVYATIEAPQGELKAKGTSHFHGTFVGQKAKAEDEGRIHVGCRGDGDGDIIYSYTLQWQEGP
ncbi:MAG: hypothetical protein KAV82_14215 [Phycisphaerae bacterium]|nr:hypothetical protein [Phycisphaerae bacterium]